jgi:hypothetical protein
VISLEESAAASLSRLGLAALLLAGCGGGLPLLHPAQTLGPGAVRASAGFGAVIATDAFATALQDATSQAAHNAGGPGSNALYAKGALVAASVAPGLAPFVGARVGVGDQTEGGLAYTGRAVRADLRRSVDISRHWALSVGAAGSAALYGRQTGEPLPDVDLGLLHGWGADVPVLLGYASDGDLYMVWLGARCGWEHVEVSQVRSVPNSAASMTSRLSLSVTSLWGGGLLGLAVGFRHVHVSVEIDASYASLTGEYKDAHAQVAGFSLAPASSLWWQF